MDLTNLDLSILETLSEEEKAEVQRILQEYAAVGYSDTLEELKNEDWAEIPVDIHTFMHDKKYLGNALYEGDRFTVFPYWEKCLEDIFPDNMTTKYNTIVFTGAIGLGKSTIAVICQLYLLYRLLCLKDPYQYYGMQVIDKLSISMMNITLENAKGVAMDKMNQMILSSEWFMAHGQMRGKTNQKYWPEKHIEIIAASSNNQIIGRALFCLDGNTEICTTNGFEKLVDLVDKEIQVISVDENNNKHISVPCTVKPTLLTNEEYQIELSDGSILKCTASHKLRLIDGSYKEAQYLTTEDELIIIPNCLDDIEITKAKIKKITKVVLPEPKQYYDVIEAAPYNNFLVKTNSGCVISHNCNFTDECVSAETIVKTTDGDKKIIDLVGKKFKVYNIDANGKLITSDYCTAEATKKTNIEYQIELADGSILKCTYNHRLMLKDDSYKRADELLDTDEIFGPENSSKIKRITKVVLPEEKQYYDIIGATPYNNFLIKTNTSYIGSHNCNFSLMSDPEKQKKKMMKMITQIDARMKSRFMRGTYLPTLNIIASSKDSEQSFLEAYISNKLEHESKNTLIVDEPQWVVDSRKDSPQKFYVGIGNKFLANELLPLDASPDLLDEYRAKGYQLWQVPIGYLDTFQLNLDEAICSIIGIATASSLKYISGIKLNETKVDTYKNPFVKDVIEVGNAPTDQLQYANFFDLTRVSPEDISKPLFIHLDMSLSGDKTGIAGVWITGKSAQKVISGPEIDQNSETQVDRDLYFKVAFSVSIKAPKGAQVSFAKNRNFIRWLRDQGFAIKGISSDTFQSANIQQDLVADGFNVKVVTVDRVQKTQTGQALCLPYHYLKAAIYERRLKIYKDCPQLTNELVGLERKADGHIDHTKDGINSKDQADAVCGATWLASQFSDEYSYSYGESLDVSLDVNESFDAYNSKQKMISDFEKELTSIWSEIRETEDLEYRQKQADFQSYQDISDGIIII